MYKIFVILLVCISAYALDYDNLALKQDFRKLDFSPGQKYHMGTINSKKSSSKNPHNIKYIFTPCLTNPETAPFIFYSMGGPGASAMAHEFFFNGPFNFNENGFSKNPYAFNKFANYVMLEYPYGSGFSINTGSYNKSYTHLKKLGRQKIRYTRLIVRFFRKFTKYHNSKIWLMGDSSTADFFPWVMNYMKTLKSNRDVLDRLVGLINEAPLMSSARSIMENPNLYRLYHLITKKQEEQILKKFKNQIKNLKAKHILSFYHNFEVTVAKAATFKRYPGKWTDYYDMATFIPDTATWSPKWLLIPGLRIFFQTKQKLGMQPLNFNMKKIVKTYDLPTRDSKGRYIDHQPFNSADQSANWEYFVKKNQTKILSKLLKNGYKYVAYFGELDACGSVIAFVKQLQDALSKEEYAKFDQTKWQRLGRDTHMKIYKNIWFGNLGQYPHLLGQQKPKSTYELVKKVVLDNW